MDDPLQHEVELLKAEKKLVEAQLDALQEYVNRIEPVLKQAIKTALELKNND